MSQRDGFASMVPRMEAYEQRELACLAADQVTHVPLDEYAIGHPHYERLLVQMHEASAFRWPSQREGL